MEVGTEQLLLYFLGTAREITRAKRFGHPAPGRSAPFPTLCHSPEGRSLPPLCHLCQEGKQGRVWGLVPSERRREGGSMGAPVKTQVLGFHCLKGV